MSCGLWDTFPAHLHVYLVPLLLLRAANCGYSLHIHTEEESSLERDLDNYAPKWVVPGVREPDGCRELHESIVSFVSTCNFGATRWWRSTGKTKQTASDGPGEQSHTTRHEVSRLIFPC